MPGYLIEGLLRPNVVGIAIPKDLRAVAPSSLFANGMSAFAVATGDVFTWDATSVAADDSLTVIKPNDLGVFDPGRWLKLTLSGGGGGKAPLLFGLSGPYTDAVVPGTFDPPVLIEVAATINTVSLLREDAGLAGNTTVDVVVNESSIFALPADRPTVSFGAGSYAFDVKPPTVGGGVLNPGDIVEVYLVEKETGDTERPQGIRVAINIA